jgi:CRP-like cAMP-binding protein
MYHESDPSNPAENTPSLPEMRRSGTERRMELTPSPQDRRQDQDRRELLQNIDGIIARYRIIPLFQNLDAEQMVKMLRICSKKKILGEQKIYRAGQEPKDMYIVLKGILRVLSPAGDVWMRIAPFGTIGETGVFIDETITADVITDTECIVLKLNKLELDRVLGQDMDLHLKLLRNILRYTTVTLRHDHEEMVKLAYRLDALDKI